jgi:uncharacterized membrane protein
MALASLFIAGFTVIYFNFRPDTFFLATKPVPLVHDPVWRTAFYIHITSSMVCLAIGPFQFLKKLRNRYLSLHRTLGKIYVACILCLGGPTGLYMAFFANGGFWTSLGFFLLSLGWWLATCKAYTTVRQRKIKAHEQWMIRSFALGFSAVTLRMLWMPLLSFFLTDHQQILHITAFLNWIPNLIVAELLIRYRFRGY